MGNSQSTPSSSAPAPLNSGECPVQHKNTSSMSSDKCPVQHKPSEPVSASQCPVQHKKGDTHKPVYNVYSQEIDPTNQMPSNPNQVPKDGQKYPLSVNRVQSTIPKGNTAETWSYPSEQMFFNSLKRKGKGDDAEEGDIPTIIAIHNNMNERTWLQVREWEETLHPGSNPKLLRFIGRPDDLSPLAKMKLLFGGDKPFDRHDWTIIRENGEEVRYIIDYYFDEQKSAQDETPGLHSAESVKSISMYARPALDSAGAVFDRLKFPVLKATGAISSVSFPENDGQNEEAIEHLSVEEVKETFESIRNECKEKMQAMATCNNDMECIKASNALQYCMGTIICKEEATAFQNALKSGKEDDIETKFNSMNSAIEDFEKRATKAMRQEAVENAS